LKTEPFQNKMNSSGGSKSINESTSKGFSEWVNKDIKKVEKTGDWSDLLKKSEKSLLSFRNSFYK